MTEQRSHPTQEIRHNAVSTLRGWRIAFVVLILLLAAAIEACGAKHSGTSNSRSSSDGNKSALCRFDEDFSRAGKSAHSEAEYLALFKSFEPRFGEAVSEAPSNIKPDVQTLVSGMRKMIRAHSTSVLHNADKDEFAQAGDNLDSYCGIN